jgi:uncharacterized protein (DUF2267 family)
MTTHTFSTFETAASVAHEWVNQVAETLGIDDRKFALQALRGVLHALRDRLTIDQSAHLSAQLPLLVRGLYFENWDPKPAPTHDRTVRDFAERVRPVLPVCDDDELVQAVGAVFGVLQAHLSPGEADKLERVLPRDLAFLWDLTAP